MELEGVVEPDVVASLRLLGPEQQSTGQNKESRWKEEEGKRKKGTTRKENEKRKEAQTKGGAWYFSQ